ncbi:SHOCT domain-containing protein [Acetobacterium tundrae]|nr:SHOCT domain-containing protein [Acetobacterium tundrae]
MGLKDLFKDVTDLAKDSIDSIQADLALKKEEQERLRADMEQRVKSFTDTLMEQLLKPIEPAPNPFINSSDDVIVSFTKNFFEKLLLPANSSSATKIDMHPYEDKVIKTVLKNFPTYSLQEKFLFQFKDSKGQIVLLTTNNLYFKVIFPENHSFFAVGSVPKEKIYDITINSADEQFKILINNITLITTPVDEVEKFDTLTLTEYLYRIKNNDLAISDDQANVFIQSKLDQTTSEIVKTFLTPDEKIIYFAWGLDNPGSKKFLTCTDKKIILYDRDLSDKKCFDYDEILSLTTKPSTVSFLDLSLTLGMNPNETEIKTADIIETISFLFSREAEYLVQIYQEHKIKDSVKKDEETSSKQQEESFYTQQPSAPDEDPIAMIEKLSVLKEKGIITEEEFNQKKQELLAKL